MLKLLQIIVAAAVGKSVVLEGCRETQKAK
jgi:outer membrane murein-binding lipoprotein Lpp